MQHVRFSFWEQKMLLPCSPHNPTSALSASVQSVILNRPKIKGRANSDPAYWFGSMLGLLFHPSPFAYEPVSQHRTCLRNITEAGYTPSLPDMRQS